jgi:hypothetical protein
MEKVILRSSFFLTFSEIFHSVQPSSPDAMVLTNRFRTLDIFIIFGEWSVTDQVSIYSWILLCDPAAKNIAAPPRHSKSNQIVFAFLFPQFDQPSHSAHVGSLLAFEVKN